MGKQSLDTFYLITCLNLFNLEHNAVLFFQDADLMPAYKDVYHPAGQSDLANIPVLLMYLCTENLHSEKFQTS